MTDRYALDEHRTLFDAYARRHRMNLFKTFKDLIAAEVEALAQAGKLPPGSTPRA